MIKSNKTYKDITIKLQLSCDNTDNSTANRIQLDEFSQELISEINKLVNKEITKVRKDTLFKYGVNINVEGMNINVFPNI